MSSRRGSGGRRASFRSLRRRSRALFGSTLVVVSLVLGSAAAATPAVALSEPDGRSSVQTGTDVITAPMRTEGASIIDGSGRPVVIRSVSWFGMETSNCAPHGLWSISLDESMASIFSMGFNTIRLPFSNQCLAQSATSSIDATKNPDLVSLSPLQLMDRVIESAASHGLAVILDRHRPDSAGQSELWYTAEYGEARWIADWQMLATRYVDVPSVIGVDLHNEPHASACWGCGDVSTDWRAAATRAGNAVLAANPGLLIVVEGVERQADGSTTWWGGGLADVAKAPVVLDMAGRVVYSPHDYPASVFRQAWFDAAAYPANLDTVWDDNWGYIARDNIAPVLLGEFGTRDETASDKQWLAALVDYLDRNELSFSFWSFNPNSADTGGLVADDWVTPQAEKLNALAPILPDATHVPVPTPTPPTPTPTPTSAPAHPAHPADPLPGPVGTETETATANFTVQSEWGEGYVAEVVLSSSQSVGAWSISWSDPTATGIENAWGMDCDVADARVTCRGVDWAVPIGPGHDARVGVQVCAQDAPTRPVAVVVSTH